MKENNFEKYANSFQAIARLELESITLMLDFLNHPEKDLKFIHVAGTNGKGSVCSFLQKIFTNEGKRCGKYISPNMLSVCERISIDGEDIPKEELNKLLDFVYDAAKKVESRLGEMPTQFEIWTAAAFCYFKMKNCDIVILETGLGGRLDATNVIPAPEASVITRIDIDHTSYLGDTLAKIASQKAGIIKRKEKKALTVTILQEREAMEVLKDVCHQKNNTLAISKEPVIHSPDGMCEVIDYGHLKNLKVGICGYHQIENAALAIEVALQLGVSDEAIKKGIEEAKNIGRFDLVKKNPPIIFDGAHNPNGMRALILGLKRYFVEKKPSFVMGFMQDKDIFLAIEEIYKIYPDAKIFTVMVKDNPRAISAEKLAEKIKEVKMWAKACPDIKSALIAAQKEGEPVVICGSLYLYKDFVESYR